MERVTNDFGDDLSIKSARTGFQFVKHYPGMVLDHSNPSLMLLGLRWLSQSW